MPRLRHFLIEGTAQSQRYLYPSETVRVTFELPPRDDRAIHGDKLATAVHQAATDLQATSDVTTDDIAFVPIVLKSDPEFTLYLQSLENKTLGLELINVKTLPDGSQQATVHVPKAQVSQFAKKFEDYAYGPLTKKKNEPPNRKLVESITELHLAMLRNGDYWMDSLPPPNPDERFWWEVWLRSDVDFLSDDGQPITVDAAFRNEARTLNLRLSDRQSTFPDYVVILAYTSLNELMRFPSLLRYVGEFRRATIVPGEFLELTPAGQQDFVDAMLERTRFASPNAPAVCLLDRGVNRGHPLLEHALAEEHNLAWEDDWTAADRRGHGTEMAGLALYGPELGELLLSDQPIELQHRLEAVKILPDTGENDPPDYGPITVGSVAKIEIEAPDRPRTLCMAITATDKDQGFPTLWSASIDQMCSGAVDGHRRLMFVSAGNVPDQITANGYPTVNYNSSVQDPAQAWNVVTVGAYTEKFNLDPDLDGYQLLGQPGGLCPSSTTSCSWSKLEWPLKPDIVMEGGNYAYNPSGDVTEADNLSLLTTFSSPTGALFSTSRNTSAATALASRYSALLHAEYPNYWPETIRGLLIHSARWTPRMIEEFPYPQRHKRLRCYGYGVPNLTIARECANNRATMIIQDSFQPFRWDAQKKATATNDMHVHALPWPTKLLGELGEMLRMRVTLSYFIEPSPGRKGWTRQNRYQSHGLRFAVKRPHETITQFNKRLTKAAWDDGGGPIKGDKDAPGWELGSDLRTKGSIHSDVWNCTAADLAASGSIAVFPITGWWRERPNRQCIDKPARYALIVTIDCDTNIDIYSSIQTVIANRTDITVTV